LPKKLGGAQAEYGRTDKRRVEQRREGQGRLKLSRRGEQIEVEWWSRV